MTLPTSRIIFLIVALGTASAMGVALYMEHVMELEPCPLCMFQRVMMVIAGAVALLAAIHGPGQLGIRIYAGLMALAAAVGGGIASRQIWLQSLPEDEVPACGASLDYLMDVFPLTEVITMVLTADGSCAEVQWTMLGLSIPGWTLVAFIGVIGIALFQMANPKTA